MVFGIVGNRVPVDHRLIAGRVIRNARQLIFGERIDRRSVAGRRLASAPGDPHVAPLVVPEVARPATRVTGRDHTVQNVVAIALPERQQLSIPGTAVLGRHPVQVAIAVGVAAPVPGQAHEQRAIRVVDGIG